MPIHRPHWVLVAIVLVAAASMLYRRLSEGRHESTARRTAEATLPAGDEYVGYSTCADCHPEQARRFAQSGHAQTFRVTAEVEDFDWLRSAEYYDADRDVFIRYDVDADGVWARIPSRLPGREFPLHYALGSGQHAVTFLSLIPSELGATVGIEHRVSIFSDGSLQRTPSAASLPPTQDVEYFGKLVTGEKLIDCIGCHTTTSRIENAQVADLRPNVQCERCHGPGSRHVAAVEAGADELHLRFVPGRLSVMDEIRMCGECHRLPEMFEDELRESDPKLARFQPVGLLQSECFTGSGGELRCTTCHDPHEASAARPRAVYEAACARCHEEHSVAECSVAAENCIDCHMPPVEVHPGIAFHDHWIRVRDGDDPRPAAETGR